MRAAQRPEGEAEEARAAGANRDEPAARWRGWTRVGLVLGAVAIADQLTKKLIRASMTPGTSHRVLPGIDLVDTRNHGVAFGTLASGHDTAIIGVIAVALLGVVVYFARHARRPLVWLPTGLLLGGALGNLFDRLRDGAVTDFIKLPVWPAFNLADIAITFGVLSLLYVLEGGTGWHDGD